MNGTKEISALFNLIDDPDLEVFSTVENRLISYGKEIIAPLENLWEQTISEAVQERIETIIHKLHYKDLTTEFETWKNGDADLLFGALLVAKYQFPEMVAATPLQEIEKIRRNVWIEMNSYLTPLEQVKVMESILYNYYKIKGGEIAYQRTNEFMLHKLLESKKGNAITTAILYLVLCEMLDIPIKVINIPQQFILAYFSPQVTGNWDTSHPFSNNIKFFIDPSSGAAYSHQDIDTYFTRIQMEQKASYFKPMNNKQVVSMLLTEFAQCFDDLKHTYKCNELLQLAELIRR